MRRAGLLITIILATLTLRWDACAQKPIDVSEDAAKTICLYNFAVYVDWPATTFVSADSPFVIGVLGDDAFAGDLDKAINDKKAQGRKLVVRKLKWSRDLKDSKDFKDCHLLYIAAAEAVHGDEIIQMRKGTPTLTIADFPDFARHGGIINFIIEDSKLHFEVNVDAAKQSDLNISSRVLKLAKIVQTGSSWR
jgi:hypothetical protein